MYNGMYIIHFTQIANYNNCTSHTHTSLFRHGTSTASTWTWLCHSSQWLSQRCFWNWMALDKDDETPLTAAEKLPSSGPTLSSSSQTPHPFFLGHAQAPAIFVAGSCCSGHAIHPSNHVVDPDNTMNLAPGWSSTRSKVVTGKWKASTQRSSRHVVQKTDHTSEESNDDNSDGEDLMPSQPMHGNLTDIEATDIEASKDAVSEQEYALLKAMADADHKVSTTSTSKIIHFTHLVLRQSTQSQRVMPLLMFAQSSNRIKNTGIQILQRFRMDTGASFACKQLNSKQSVFRYK